MLIPNLTTFTGLDPTITPSIQHGSLDPATQFASAELLAMAMGSLYIQKSVTLGPNCTVLGTSACLWIKVDRSQDSCSPLGSPKDWRRCCCFSLLEGATPPSPGVDPWCKAQTGDWYLQTGSAGSCAGLWLKIKDNCGSDDWYNVSGGKCLIVDNKPPDPVLLCDYEIGTHYVDTSSPCPTLYLKIYDNCNAADWMNLADGCVYRMTGSPVGNVADTALCKLPIGAIVLDTTTPAPVRSIYWKVADNCDGNDYVGLPSLCQLKEEVTATIAASAMVPPSYFVKDKDGNCGWHTSDTEWAAAAASYTPGVPLTTAGAVVVVPGAPVLSFTLPFARAVKIDTTMDINAVPVGTTINDYAAIYGHIIIDGVLSITNGQAVVDSDDNGESLRWFTLTNLSAGAHTVQLAYELFNGGSAPVLDLFRFLLVAYWEE